MCEEEEEASHLNVYITLAEFLCSICWTNDAVNRKKNELFIFGRFFFLIATHRIRLILFSPFRTMQSVVL